MFKKILIANRGEIACRVMETARKMGVKTVAIYSDADANAKHVEMADEAWRVGPPAVADSYLQGDKIIEIALASGAEGIHPGYGFLSENPDFVDKVEAAGLRFIGPSASAIRAMGLKDAAKSLMEKANVPVVPGYHGESQDPEFLAAEADKMGYPVLIKARAGGGGKGMRKVEAPNDFAEALAGAQREGLAAFGDATCLVEKWITTPRHIEIQVFGDDYGDAIYLFERDCSLQRRHQKVIEEAPAPGMTEEMRRVMGDAAVRCAKSIGYSGAGTIEFIVDTSDGLKPDRFWFMEMNTRLQVEHPVTEFITGIDLVEWQLRIASGEKLPCSQSDLTLNGHAFEARIYAEDVPAGFLPATGVLEELDLPQSARIDSGVRQGDTITPWYDPMISKLIVHGATREIALNKLKSAIDASKICGTTTNLEFLSKLCAHEEFSAGLVDTGLIERDIDTLTDVTEVTPVEWAIAAVLGQGTSVDRTFDGWNLWTPLSRSISLSYGGEVKELLVETLGDGKFSIRYDTIAVIVELTRTTAAAQVYHEGKRFEFSFFRHANDLTLFGLAGPKLFAIVTTNSVDDANNANENNIISPMPGLVKVVEIEGGDTCEDGNTLVVIEAMKMEHTLVAPRNCRVAEVLVSVGQQVEAGEVLVTFEGDDD